MCSWPTHVPAGTISPALTGKGGPRQHSADPKHVPGPATFIARKDSAVARAEKELGQATVHNGESTSTMPFMVLGHAEEVATEEEALEFCVKRHFQDLQNVNSDTQ